MLNKNNPMKVKDALITICATIGDAFDGNFPCICGQNKLADNLTEEDKNKLEKILKAIETIEK